MQTEPRLEDCQEVPPELAGEATEQKPPEEKKVETPKKETASLVIPIEGGKLQLANHKQFVTYCDMMVKSGMVPSRFDSYQKLFGAIMYVRDLGLPDTSIRQVANIEGTPSLFGDLPLALVKRSGLLESFREDYYDKAYNLISFENKNLHEQVYASVTFVKRKDVPEKSYAFTLDDAKTAGLYPATKRDGTPSPYSPWNKYTKIMMRYKSRSIALKNEFPDILNGIGIAEYDHEALPEKDVTPILTKIEVQKDIESKFEDELEQLKKEHYANTNAQNTH